MAISPRLLQIAALGRVGDAPCRVPASVLVSGGARWLSGCRLFGGWGWCLCLGLVLWAGNVGAQRPLIQLNLLPGPGSNATDQAYVYFEQGATTGFDSGFDAIKLPNSTGLNIASFEQSGLQLVINGLPPAVLSAPFTVALFVGVPLYATYTFEVGQLNNFATTTVYLNDGLLNVRTRLVLGTTVAFDMTAANTSGTFTTSTRFALQFDPVTTPLPVTLTRFEAVAQPPGVQVSWQTASEQQSDYFAVERSPDGQHFGAIGRVMAAGTSAQARAYHFADAGPEPGLAYYRLRQVDRDGSSTFSPVRAVRTGAPGLAAQVLLFPNPAHAAVAVPLPAGLSQQPVGAALVDAGGRVVLRRTLPAGPGPHLLPLDGLASGLYSLRLQTEAGVIVKKLRVE